MHLQRLTKTFFILVILASLLNVSLPGNAAHAQAAGFRLQYRAADTNAGDNQIKPHFNIVNQSGSAVPLSELKIRYWYTREGTAGQNFWCDYSAITGSCSNVTGNFVQVSPARPGADFYLEVGFSAAAGSIAAGGQSGEIQTRFAKTDWSNYTETGDYSFDPTKTAFADWTAVTLYRNGVLIWGTEPGGTGGTSTPTPTGVTVTNTPTNTPVTNTPTFTPTQPSGNNTGWVSPSNQASQSGGDGNGFQTSPTNAFADGGGVATDTNSGTGTSTSCTNTGKDRHAYFNYALSIPTGSTISGIEVRTDARADSTSNAPHFCVQVSWNNGTSWTAMKTGPNLLTSERTDILGSATDTWGRTWNTSELTSANFRVRLVSVASSTSRDFFLDWVPVRVWYSGGGVTPTSTPTNTPVTNTPTFTPTFAPTVITNTPTNTPTTGPTTLRLQYRAADTTVGDNQIKPHFNIVNPGTSAVPLSELKIRYWYTREGTVGQNFWCDYSAINGSCSNVTGTFVQVSPARPGADFYLEVGFSAAAGSIAAGGQSGEIQTRFAKTDWSNYTETGDYSFDPTKTAFADWTRVTLYRNGVLVWGIEP